MSGTEESTEPSPQYALEAIDMANDLLSDALDKASTVDKMTPLTHIAFKQVEEAHAILSRTHPDWENPE